MKRWALRGLNLLTLLATALTLGLASKMVSLVVPLASRRSSRYRSSSLFRLPDMPTRGWLQREMAAWLSLWIHDSTWRDTAGEHATDAQTTPGGQLVCVLWHSYVRGAFLDIGRAVLPCRLGELVSPLIQAQMMDCCGFILRYNDMLCCICVLYANSESERRSLIDWLIDAKEGDTPPRPDTHRYASSRPEGRHPSEVLIRGLVGHGQDGGVRVAQIVVLVGKGDPPPFVGQALGGEGKPEASRVIHKTSQVSWMQQNRACLSFVTVRRHTYTRFE